MPVEKRQINFTPEEVTRAVAKLLVHHGMIPAGHKVTGLDVKKAGEKIAGVVTVAIPGATKSRKLPLNNDVLTAALIRMCREILIPMPRGARKVLIQQDDGLALHLSFDTADATPQISVQTEPSASSRQDPLQSGKQEDDDDGSEAEPVTPDWWATMSKTKKRATRNDAVSDVAEPDWWATVSKAKQKKKTNPR